MNRTSTVAVIIHAVLAGSSFGGSAAPTRGACVRKSAKRRFPSVRRTMGSLPSWCKKRMSAPLHAPSGSIPDLFQVFSVEAEGAAGPIREPMLQGDSDGAERDVLPGD